MGVQPNIKDPDTVRLARALAERSGNNVTETIRAGLQQASEERDDA
ncbi:type II toxin-antitoxin system VapB family antitoxin [Sphingomonas sp. Leaf412]|nr:type II toxin-antitoxin system VapB family antitoxin [Sphingomonas sp. Leaf412]